jgi:hypothetical protein
LHAGIFNTPGFEHGLHNARLIVNKAERQQVENFYEAGETVSS